MRKLLVAFGLAFALFLVPAFGQEDELEKGVALYRSADYAGAVDTLQKLVDASSKNRIAWRYLGGALMYLGREKEALKAFKRSIGGSKVDTQLDKELKIISKPKVRYTDEARRREISGTVTNMVEYKADGTIGFVVTIESLPNGLTEGSVEAARNTSFSPAERNGKPVSVIRVATNRFSIF